MFVEKLLSGATAAVVLVAAAWVGGTGRALADYRSDRAALCGPSDYCSINIRDKSFSLIEGVSKATVDVVGTPNVTRKLQMYVLEFDLGTDSPVGVRPYGSPVPFTTNGSGKTTVLIPIASLTAPDGANSSIMFQLPGATYEQITYDKIMAVPGVNHGQSVLPDLLSVRSARGEDQNAWTTVDDGSLEAKLVGGLTGDLYGVQIRKPNGAWIDATDPSVHDNGRVDAVGEAVVHANLTAYADGSYEMRMFNRTRGIFDLTLRNDQGSLDIKMNLYITPGRHLANGRNWRTTCEPYSITERCRTEIWSTAGEYRAGKFFRNTGWHVNNLTYKASGRDLWKGNPLGNTGAYLIGGRKWRTECDTAVTGMNGCRSYIVANVVQATKKGNSYAYQLVTKEVFNNIVLFDPHWPGTSLRVP